MIRFDGAASGSAMFLDAVPTAREWTRAHNTSGHIEVWRRAPIALDDVGDSETLTAEECRRPKASLRDSPDRLEAIAQRFDDPRTRTQWAGIVRAWRREAPLHSGVSRLPVPVVSVDEDGGAAVEWVLSDRRFGFTLSPNDEESGWYFSSLPESGGLSASGHLSMLDIKQMLMWALATPSTSCEGYASRTS